MPSASFGWLTPASITKLERRERFRFFAFCLQAENLLTLWRMICVGSGMPRVRNLSRTIGMKDAGDGILR